MICNCVPDNILWKETLEKNIKQDDWKNLPGIKLINGKYYLKISNNVEH